MAPDLEPVAAAAPQARSGDRAMRLLETAVAVIALTVALALALAR